MLSYCHDGAKIKMDAERIMGAWLAENVDHKGGDAATLSQRARALPDWVDNRSQSSRWQQSASLPTPRASIAQPQPYS